MFSIPTMISHGVTYAYAAVLMAAAGCAGGGFVQGSLVPERLSVFGDGSEPQPRVLVAKNSKKTFAPPSTRCTAGLFTGTWTYPNCNAATIEFTMGCTGHDDTTCSFQETIVDFAGAQEINACPIGGLFQDETGSNVAYNASNGRCEIDYFHFTEDRCGLYPQLGMKAYINLNEEDDRGPPATMYLLFSEDGGETFYNKDNQRVATRISSDTRRDLMEEQEEHSETPSSSWSSVATDSTEFQRRRLCGSIEVVPECTLSCKKEWDETKKLGEDCCINEQISGTCTLNKADSTCNCSDNVKCYIEMSCDDNEIWQDNACRLKPEIPECSISCKNEYFPDRKWTNEECCENAVGYGGQSDYCILNSDSSTCNCISDEGRCYIDMRCEDERFSWQNNRCRLKPEILQCTKRCEMEKDAVKGWTNRGCCEEEQQTDKCVLNTESSTCNCGEGFPFESACYIDMHCYENDNKTCDVPECTSECKAEKDEKGNDRRQCCKENPNENSWKNLDKCILNWKSSNCKCNDNVPCYIDTRCKDDNQTWQNDWCVLKPGAVCYKYPSTVVCSKGYKCEGDGKRCVPS